MCSPLASTTKEISWSILRQWLVDHTTPVLLSKWYKDSNNCTRAQPSLPPTSSLSPSSLLPPSLPPTSSLSPSSLLPHSLQINWPTKTISTVVDVVNRPPQGESPPVVCITTLPPPSTLLPPSSSLSSFLPPFPLSLSGGGFPGLYTALLPTRCWDAEGKKVLLHSWWGSTQNVVCVEVEGGGVHRVTEGQGTWTVLDVAHALVVAQFASPSTPPKLVSGRVNLSC